MSKHDTARMRGLATELTDKRCAASLSTRDAAQRAGFAPARLNRMENCKRQITPEDAATLLAVYGVFGSERDRILDLARDMNQSTWWATRGDHVPRHLAPLASMESDATHIINVSMLRVPGLLQTADYIRTVMAGGRVPRDQVQPRIAARLRRQLILHRPNPPRYLAILDEMAVRRPMGGGPMMSAQLLHLIQIAELPHVDIRIIPFDTIGHPGLDGDFALLYFPNNRPLVYLEHSGATVFADGAADAAQFQETVDRLLEAALSSADSVRLLRKIHADFPKF